MANKRLRKEILEGMQALRSAGAVSAATMREFERELFPPPPLYSPRQIKKLRDKLNISQALFAALLNVSPSTMQKWEQGQKKPNGVARKLLQIVEEQGLGVLVSEN